MRLAVLGDFHGHTKVPAFRQFLAEARPDAVLQVGDCQYYEAMPVPFYFIHGNHEHWPTINALRTGTLAPRNLHYLPDATPLVLGGVTILGLGGIPRGDSTKDSPKFFNVAAYERMAGMHADIVLTHDTPINYTTGRADPALTAQEYRLLAEIMAPRLWFSGHHHHFEAERLGPTTIVSLGKWPHQWAVVDIADTPDTNGGREMRWSRWAPIDRNSYDLRLPGWAAAERELKRTINREA